MTSTTVLVRIPNHVGDACMALPALHLLREAGLRYALVGRGWVESLFEGLRSSYLPLQGRLLRDVAHVRQFRASIDGEARGLVLPNSFGSALMFALAGVPSAGLATASPTVAPALAQSGASRRAMRSNASTVRRWRRFAPGVCQRSARCRRRHCSFR